MKEYTNLKLFDLIDKRIDLLSTMIQKQIEINDVLKLQVNQNTIITNHIMKIMVEELNWDGVALRNEIDKLTQEDK